MPLTLYEKKKLVATSLTKLNEISSGTSYTFTVSCDQPDANVKLNNVVTKTATVHYGDLLTYEITKTGYLTESKTIKVFGDTVLNVIMAAEETPAE